MTDEKPAPDAARPANLDPKLARLAASLAIALTSLLGLRGCWGLLGSSNGDLAAATIIIVVAVVLLLVTAGIIATRQIDFSNLFDPTRLLKK